MIMDGNDRQSGDGPGEKRRVEGEFSLDKVKSTIARDFREAKAFFLDEERLGRLERMGAVKRWLYTTWWLLKALFLKLTTVRRLLLLIGLICIFTNPSITIGDSHIDAGNNLKIVGGLLVLFVLLLELKDKLLARDELVAGRAVQLALLPDENPQIPNWQVWLYSRPANNVGGDLIDYVRVGEDRFGVALGDVSGKGLPAALLMAKLQATLRALATESPSLAELAAKINGIFHRDSLPRSFASLVYLELASLSGKIQIVNAGHLPPIIVRKGEVTFMDKGDRGLGISPESSYRRLEVELASGDFFIIYSDGVTEAQNENDEFFGLERLTRLISGQSDVSARAMGARILAAVDRFVDEAPRHDDLSLVILKRV